MVNMTNQIKFRLVFRFLQSNNNYCSQRLSLPINGIISMIYLNEILYLQKQGYHVRFHRLLFSMMEFLPVKLIYVLILLDHKDELKRQQQHHVEIEMMMKIMNKKKVTKIFYFYRKFHFLNQHFLVMRKLLLFQFRFNLSINKLNHYLKHN